MLERCPNPAREDEPPVLPRFAAQLLLILLGFVGTQRPGADVRQRNCPARGGRLSLDPPIGDPVSNRLS